MRRGSFKEPIFFQRKGMKTCLEEKEKTVRPWLNLRLCCHFFLLILFGIIEFGFAFAFKMQVQNASREATRYAAIHSSDSTLVSEVTQYLMDTEDINQMTNSVILSGGSVSVKVRGWRTRLLRLGTCFSEWVKDNGFDNYEDRIIFIKKGEENENTLLINAKDES